MESTRHTNIKISRTLPHYTRCTPKSVNLTGTSTSTSNLTRVSVSRNHRKQSALSCKIVVRIHELNFVPVSSSFTNNEVETFKSIKKNILLKLIVTLLVEHTFQILLVYILFSFVTQNFKMIFAQCYLLEIKLIAYDTVRSYTLQAEDLMVYLSLT